MSLTRLMLGEMVTVTGGWTGDDQETFVSVPELAGLMPLVVEAHAAVVGAEPAQPSTRVAPISEEQGRVDDQHDHALRAVFYACAAAAAHALSLDPPDEPLSRSILAARDAVLPDGLGGTLPSYAEEGGRAERAEKHLEDHPDHQKILKKVKIYEGTSALDAVHRMIEQGKRLQSLEKERSSLGGSFPTGKMSIRRARSLWLQMASTVLQNLKISKAPRETLDKIEAPLRRAIERAADRANRASKAAEGDGKTDEKPEGTVE